MGGQRKLWRSALQKRQGTKSREIGRWPCSRLYGDLTEAATLTAGVMCIGT